MIRKAETTLTRAAGYLRMSGRQQDKSPAEQKAEIVKLAAKHGCQIVQWYADEAITGDSGTDEREGLADLLREAKAGAFKVVLAWHTNRISREDPMDAVVFYNQLRKAGVGLHTCAEGAIDLDSFTAQLLLFVNQKASNDFLAELSAKSLRGKISNAKAGGWNGGPAIYGMDRGLFDAEGQLVRRLLPGETVHIRGHRVRLLPTTDQAKLAAVRFAFERYDGADLPLRQLARELRARGYPGPRTGWTSNAVARVLKTRAYVGQAQWGASAWGKYHQAQGQEIAIAQGGKWHRKPEEDVIAVEDAHEGMIAPALFARVQAKLGRKAKQKRRPREQYPLSGLLYCQHCGQPMNGRQWNERRGTRSYHYVHYLCPTYAKYGPDCEQNRTCGHHKIDAQRVLGWLVHKLQETFLGEQRHALVQEITQQLKTQAKATSGDVERLTKRAADLDREVGRLVKAIRTIDAAELVEELQIVRTERDRVKAELSQAGKLTAPGDVEAEAGRIADSLRDLAETLPDAEPAILREVLRRFVVRIDCQWEDRRLPSGKSRCELVRGNVALRPMTADSCNVAAQGCWPRRTGCG